jgi:hypothetical protein
MGGRSQPGRPMRAPFELEAALAKMSAIILVEHTLPILCRMVSHGMHTVPLRRTNRLPVNRSNARSRGPGVPDDPI